MQWSENAKCELDTAFTEKVIHAAAAGLVWWHFENADKQHLTGIVPGCGE